MRICWLGSVLFSAAVIFSCGSPSVQRVATPDRAAKQSNPAPIAIGTRHELRSQTYGDVRTINIYIPPMDDGTTAPVLFVLDGGIDQDFLHIAGLSQLATVNGNFVAPIVVGIESKNRRSEFTQEPIDPRFRQSGDPWGGAEKFNKYLVDEVFPLLERTIASKISGQPRIVMGESLAALFVVGTFLQRPDLFDAYIAISPSLWYDDRRFAKNVTALLASHRAPTSGKRNLYLTMADEGGTMQLGLDEVLAALRAKQPPGLVWSYVDRRATEHHWTIYHGAALDALRWLLPLPPPESKAPAWFLEPNGVPPGYVPPKQ